MNLRNSNQYIVYQTINILKKITLIFGESTRIHTIISIKHGRQHLCSLVTGECEQLKTDTPGGGTRYQGSKGYIIAFLWGLL